MAVVTLVSVDEYLATTYRPDCDYIDGEVRERNLGEREHGTTQIEIGFFLRLQYPQLRGRIITEQRVQVSATRFRVPDLCIAADEDRSEPILHKAPLLCVEILSRTDTLQRTVDRLDDYFAMGVPVCWVIDPVGRRGWVATPGILKQAEEGVLRAGGIEMPLNAIFV